MPLDVVSKGVIFDILTKKNWIMLGH